MATYDYRSDSVKESERTNYSNQFRHQQAMEAKAKGDPSWRLYEPYSDKWEVTMFWRDN